MRGLNRSEPANSASHTGYALRDRNNRATGQENRECQNQLIPSGPQKQIKDHPRILSNMQHHFEIAWAFEQCMQKLETCSLERDYLYLGVLSDKRCSR
jgi:hypothetical protein